MKLRARARGWARKREREKRDERETARDEKRGREREWVCVMAGHHSIKLTCEWIKRYIETERGTSGLTERKRER